MGISLYNLLQGINYPILTENFIYKMSYQENTNYPLDRYGQHGYHPPHLKILYGQFTGFTEAYYNTIQLQHPLQYYGIKYRWCMDNLCGDATQGVFDTLIKAE